MIPVADPVFPGKYRQVGAQCLETIRKEREKIEKNARTRSGGNVMLSLQVIRVVYQTHVTFLQTVSPLEEPHSNADLGVEILVQRLTLKHPWMVHHVDLIHLPWQASMRQISGSSSATTDTTTTTTTIRYQDEEAHQPPMNRTGGKLQTQRQNAGNKTFVQMR